MSICCGPGSNSSDGNYSVSQWPTSSPFPLRKRGPQGAPGSFSWPVWLLGSDGMGPQLTDSAVGRAL